MQIAKQEYEKFNRLHMNENCIGNKKKNMQKNIRCYWLP